MTLWNLIRDFFVEHIFGGTLSNSEAITGNTIGFFNDKSVSSIYADTSDYQFLKVGDVLIDSTQDYVMQDGVYIGLGDWLSTTFTIITLILLVIVLYIFVKWIFKLFAGLLYR